MYTATGAPSKAARPENEIVTIENAIKFYKLDYNKLPDSIADLVGCCLEKVPLDPWGRRYHYAVERPAISTRQLDFYVWTLGADGITGGSNEDSDIGNWTIIDKLERPWWKLW